LFDRRDLGLAKQVTCRESEPAQRISSLRPNCAAALPCDEAGRTVTTVHDGRGCRITIDERDLSGEE
jgi:hypothetical protein